MVVETIGRSYVKQQMYDVQLNPSNEGLNDMVDSTATRMPDLVRIKLGANPEDTHRH
jgi:hypothetical protein